MTIIKNIAIYHSLGLPILMGAWKKFIKELSGKNDSSLRIGGQLALVFMQLCKVFKC